MCESTITVRDRRLGLVDGDAVSTALGEIAAALGTTGGNVESGYDPT